jgi:ElaB/YqjD/DUF883 family membrane-anchored ribosome-binding protein
MTSIDPNDPTLERNDLEDLHALDDTKARPETERPEGKEDVRTTEDVKRDLERTRAELAETTVILREKLALGRRIEEWVHENPAVAIAGAFVFGFLVGFRR